MNALTETNITMTEQTIDKALRLAESEGTLLNRPLVEAAMKRRKKQITDLSEQMRRYELQNWLICLDDNGTNTLIGTLVHKIESTPEMTITQFAESMKTLIAKEEAQ